MADPNTRQGKRTPVTLKIKFKSETLEQFIERYAVDVSQGGIFIRTKEPLAVGTQMKFEFQLKDASPLIAGEGTVVWTRENDPSRPAIAPGMGVRFDRLAEGSQQVLERILAEKAKQAPSRTSTDSPTKPPLFTDTPTKVAPVPVQDALMGNRSGRTRADSEQTPLPNPMPFHSDADDFDEKAFEEATKVRSLDELVAETARTDDAATKEVALPASDELAARRHIRPDTPLAEPPRPDGEVDRDSAPGLPSPPATGAATRSPKMLDTTPSPREEKRPSAPPQETAARTRLGIEPAKAQTGRGAAESAVPRAVAAASDASRPAAPARRPSSAPIIVAILVVVAAAVAGVWYFVLRDQVGEEQAAKKPQTPPTPGSGSAGSAAIATHTGSGSGAVESPAGSGSAAKPAGPTADTVIASSVPNAKVEVLGTDQSGPAPFTAKLEKDKSYHVRIDAPGFAPSEIEVKGGQDKVVAKLTAKPHALIVSSEPPGAQVFIDNAATGKSTPATIELSAAQAARPKLHVMLRKPGFRPVDQMVEAAAFSEEDTKVTASVDAKLAAMPVQVAHPPNNGNNAGTGSASPAGGGTDAGTGSAATPPPPPPPTGSATGSAAPGEPEPEWKKQP